MSKNQRVLTHDEIVWELEVMKDNFIHNRNNGASIKIGTLKRGK